jgi:hypothetical protein
MKRLLIYFFLFCSLNLSGQGIGIIASSGTSSAAYGAELVDHGDFSAVGTWVIEGDQASITGGALVINGTAWSTIGSQSISITIGKTYKVEFDVTVTSGKIAVYFGNSDYGSGSDVQYTTSQHVSRDILYSEASAPAQIFLISWDVGFVGSIDDLSVKEKL